MRVMWGALSVVLLALPVWATAPELSPRPQPRVINHPGIVLLPTAPMPRPVARPISEQRVATTSRNTTPLLGPVQSVRPSSRPPSILERVLSRNRAARRGMVCGLPEIQGDVVGFVPGRIDGCGISDAVRVKSVSGVTLSQPALMDCTTAKALNRWVKNGARPAFQQKGQVVQLRVAAHYACRTRNNQPGARISEHGKGRAIDVSGFVFADGQMITVLEHWNKRGFRSAMRRAHRTACGPFGTVLGPESDRFHRDHFHFDTARYRSGPYCR